jgi:molybdopterin-containing oxidoreductase family membrane subunit
MIFNITAFFLFLVPETRKNNVTLTIGCILVFIGVYIEKGMGLVIPGFIPDVLHEIYEYAPTGTEMLLAMGIWATGLFVFTMLLRVAIPIMNGDFHVAEDGVGSFIGDQLFLVHQKPMQTSETINSESEHVRENT